MKHIFFIIAAVIPSRLHAAVPVTDVLSLQQLIFDFFSKLSTFFWSATIAFFVFGVVKFIKNSDNEAEREKGRLFILWAIIAFVVLVSLWGLVAFFADTLGITTGGTPSFVNKNGAAIVR